MRKLHPNMETVSVKPYDSSVKLVSSALCIGVLTCLLHDDINLEQANFYSSPHGSDDTSASSISCAADGTGGVIDGSNKLHSLTPNVEAGTVQTMAVHNTFKCVAENDETRLEGTKSLASSNCVELERAETFMGNVLAENVHLSGDEVI
uniref:Uncharacterized protein n=1 Tax=Arundo donax TaxID=35708 RepID=A0A0A9BSJ0_ARUDO